MYIYECLIKTYIYIYIHTYIHIHVYMGVYIHIYNPNFINISMFRHMHNIIYTQRRTKPVLGCVFQIV